MLLMLSESNTFIVNKKKKLAILGICKPESLGCNSPTESSFPPHHSSSPKQLSSMKSHNKKMRNQAIWRLDSVGSSWSNGNTFLFYGLFLFPRNFLLALPECRNSCDLIFELMGFMDQLVIKDNLWGHSCEFMSFCYARPVPHISCAFREIQRLLTG